MTSSDAVSNDYILYNGETTDFEEGKTYSLSWNVPLKYAGGYATVIFSNNNCNYCRDVALSSELNINTGENRQVAIDQQRNISFTITPTEDILLENDEWFYLDFFITNGPSV